MNARNYNSLTPSLLTGLLLMAVITPACAQQRNVRKALDGEYARRLTILRKKDLPAYAKTMMDDFVWVNESGQISGKKAYLSLVSLMMESLRGSKLSTKITGLTVKGLNATATVSQQYSLVLRDKKGKPYTMAGRAVFRETWVDIGTAWKARRLEEVSSSLTRDGKPFRVKRSRVRLTPRSP